jgi:hypothetical protein
MHAEYAVCLAFFSSSLETQVTGDVHVAVPYEKALQRRAYTRWRRKWAPRRCNWARVPRMGDFFFSRTLLHVAMQAVVELYKINALGHSIKLKGYFKHPLIYCMAKYTAKTKYTTKID